MYRSGAVMAWNVFKFCTALRGLGSIMILLVLAVVGLTYYAVVFANYGPALYQGDIALLTSLAVLILFHILLVMLLWSYFAVVFTDAGSVPPNWRPVLDEESGDADPLTGSEFSGMPADITDPRVRYCRKCNQLKPPRCHHCSVCESWEVCSENGSSLCVGCQLCRGLELQVFPSFSGMFYTFLETSLVTLSLLPYFVAFFSDGEIPGTPGMVATTFLAFVLNLAFALSVCGFLIMHISLVAANTTTIEAYEKRSTPRSRYDLGWKRNFEQVFGMDKLYWFIPAYSEEDLRRMPVLQGLEYPSKPDLDAQGF
ncbi:hypothetical protein RHSIM_Rhsim07G0027900 [Rhododendron simsii]|uniref:S-acyltransferase n=1 Tax=Rhododendron simsii TaxID=118357 RepID=A0A834GPG1_RHOSS|nr:hypothetical protein RHSIM_Rhsim07G0027900 [Rhododendron simsii]